MSNDERGATLLEVLGAAVILGIVVILFSNLFGYSLLAGKRSSDLLDVRGVAEQELHLARAAIKQNGQTPADRTVNGLFVDYSLTVQPPTSPPAGRTQSEAFTLQAVVSVQGSPRWLTVTVSREGA